MRCKVPFCILVGHVSGKDQSLNTKLVDYHKVVFLVYLSCYYHILDILWSINQGCTTQMSSGPKKNCSNGPKSMFFTHSRGVFSIKQAKWMKIWALREKKASAGRMLRMPTINSQNREYQDRQQPIVILIGSDR